MITVVSVGGSIIAPDGVDAEFIKDFVMLIKKYLLKDSERKFIFVTGGGGIARHYQNAYRVIAGVSEIPDDCDRIGIMATRLNAELIRALLCEYCSNEVVIDPTETGVCYGRVVVAAGWKPGFSSDNDAVILAQRFGAKTVINLSNIEKIYDRDPKTHKDAKPLDEISWKDFRAMIGDVWKPGANVPFDPVASKYADECGISVICAAGRNLPNLENILSERPFIGTRISG